MLGKRWRWDIGLSGHRRPYHLDAHGSLSHVRSQLNGSKQELRFFLGFDLKRRYERQKAVRLLYVVDGRPGLCTLSLMKNFAAICNA